MSKAKHTPGPWALHLSDNGTPYITHGDADGVDDLDHLICVMPAEIVNSYNSFANARLIAAATELLEALQGLIAAHAVPSSACSERPAYETAMAAIAKATQP